MRSRQMNSCATLSGGTYRRCRSTDRRGRRTRSLNGRVPAARGILDGRVPYPEPGAGGANEPVPVAFLDKVETDLARRRGNGGGDKREEDKQETEHGSHRDARREKRATKDKRRGQKENTEERTIRSLEIM